MINIPTFIQRISSLLNQQGYCLEDKPGITGARGMLYAYSPRPYPLVAARVMDHFIFMDWEYDLFSRKDHMIEAYRSFNRHVNKKFRIPNLMRITIPNMALIAISGSGFDDETLEYAQRTYLVPWKGGEVGQFFLLDLAMIAVIYHETYQRKQYGSAPLLQAQGTLLPIFKDSLKDGSTNF
jgi:hypothetical protein